VFDPAKLQINSVSNSGVLDLMLQKDFSNTSGYLNFAASSMVNTPPVGTFDLATVSFTALDKNTMPVLHFDLNQGTSQFNGNYLPQTASDATIVVGDCLKCQVLLQGRASRPDDSWITELNIHTDKIESIMTNNRGTCVLPASISLGNSAFCVKNSHTLANKIGPPIQLNMYNRVDLGTLLEGDVNNDNRINLTDTSLLKSALNTCKGNAGYNANADLNADGCVNASDTTVGFGDGTGKGSNYGKLSACRWDSSTQTLRNGQRGEAVTLRTSVIPSNLTVGENFDVIIQVHAAETQAVDGVAAYLNFDPELLQVNQLTPGDQLNFVLQNDLDNTEGHLDFAMTVWEGEIPTGQFDLATINFTLLAPGGEKSLFFNTTEDRQTEIVSEGESVAAEGNERGVVQFEQVPATCQLYLVNDDQLNNSQFFTINPANQELNRLGTVHKGYDIEALAIHPQTGLIYAASGNDVGHGHLKGHLYQVDGLTGELASLCDTGFEEIGDLTFAPDGTLWAWAKGAGLIQIDPATCQTTTVIASANPLAGLTFSKEENLIYGAVNTDLWRYTVATDSLELVCSNLPGKTEALETLTGDLLLLGTHEEKDFKVRAFDPNHCQLVADTDILTPSFKDVEGIALPVAGCVK
jgi:hypothetical protein